MNHTNNCNRSVKHIVMNTTSGLWLGELGTILAIESAINLPA